MKRPTGRALRAPLAGSPACVFAFVFILIYVYFELIMKVIDDDDDAFDDDEQKKSKMIPARGPQTVCSLNIFCFARAVASLGKSRQD